MTFKERNIEISRRWQETDSEQRTQHIKRAKEDPSILDKEMMVKRQIKKINNAVSYNDCTLAIIRADVHCMHV